MVVVDVDDFLRCFRVLGVAAVVEDDTAVEDVAAVEDLVVVCRLPRFFLADDVNVVVLAAVVEAAAAEAVVVAALSADKPSPTIAAASSSPSIIFTPESNTGSNSNPSKNKSSSLKLPVFICGLFNCSSPFDDGAVAAPFDAVAAPLDDEVVPCSAAVTADLSGNLSSNDTSSFSSSAVLFTCC